MLSRRSEPSVALAKESMAETSSGSSMPPTPARSMASRRRSGPLGSGGRRPGEGEGEVELVGRLLVLGEQHDGVLEGEEHPRIDVEGQVQVERAAAALLGVEVDLPDLAQRVRLDEVPLVVHVKPVVDGVVLQVGHVAGDVDGSHSVTSLDEQADARPRTGSRRRRPLYGERVDEARLLEVLDEAVVAVRARARRARGLGAGGHEPGQYRLDLAADDAALPILHGAGLAVLSEESGLTGDGPSGLLAVIDPVDGSTNAHRGVPFYSTSICVLDDEGPLVGLVVNQADRHPVRGDAGRRGRA